MYVFNLLRVLTEFISVYVYESIRDYLVVGSLYYIVILRKLNELEHILFCFLFIIKHSVSCHSFLGEKILIPSKRLDLNRFKYNLCIIPEP